MLFYIHTAFLICSCICISAAAVITPSNDLYICPMETVMYSCVINGEYSNILRWTIYFTHHSIQPIEITLIGGDGQPDHETNHIRTNNIQQSATFRLISTSPDMNSSLSMMIKESPEFSQVFVQCKNPSVTSERARSTIHIITQGS